MLQRFENKQKAKKTGSTTMSPAPSCGFSCWVISTIHRPYNNTLLVNASTSNQRHTSRNPNGGWSQEFPKALPVAHQQSVCDRLSIHRSGLKARPNKTHDPQQKDPARSNNRQHNCLSSSSRAKKDVQQATTCACTCISAHKSKSNDRVEEIR